MGFRHPRATKRFDAKAILAANDVCDFVPNLAVVLNLMVRTLPAFWPLSFSLASSVR